MNAYERGANLCQIPETRYHGVGSVGNPSSVLHVADILRLGSLEHKLHVAILQSRFPERRDKIILGTRDEGESYDVRVRRG